MPRVIPQPLQYGSRKGGLPQNNYTLSGQVADSLGRWVALNFLNDVRCTGQTGNPLVEGQVLTFSGGSWINYFASATTGNEGIMSFTVAGDNGTPFTVTSGETLQFVGQTGIDIGVADPEVRIAMDYNGADSFIMAATNGTGITVDGSKDKLVIYDSDAALVKYINANQLPGSTTVSYWSGNTDGSISNSGLTTTKVGIGTDTPSALFEVKDLIKFPGINGDLFIGASAGANWESGSQSNTALGKLAMGMGTMNSALQNTAIGFASLSYITTGDLNTAIGIQASQALDTGSYNTSLGATALFGGTYHSYNTAIGAQAMYFTTNGGLGKKVITDTHNTAVGYHSQYYNLDGAYNTSVGSQSIGSNTIAMAGTGSTAMGYKSLFNNTTGNYNTALGYHAGDNITTGDYNISIGPNADPPSATADYQMNIGNILYGKDLSSSSSINAIGIGTNSPSYKLEVSGNIGGTADLGISGATDIAKNLRVSGDTQISGNILQPSVNSIFNNGDYFEIGTGFANTGQLTFNANHDGGVSTNTYTPVFAGNVNAGMTVIKMPSGGYGGLEFYIKNHGTTSGSQNLSTFTKILDLNQDGNSAFGGRVGIGTSPGSSLHISTADNVITKFVSTDSIATIELGDNSTSNQATLTRVSNDLKICKDGGNIGIPIAPKTKLDVQHNPTSLSNNTGGGESVTFGTASGSLTKGKLYYLNTSGVWTLAQANASSSNGNNQLLGIALGTAVSDGLLIRGFFDMHSYLTGTFNEGIPLYVCETTAGNINVAAPGATNEFVRVVGYCTSTSKVIYFNPDGTYITVA